MPTFSAHGIEIAYATHGKGPPVLLIHGFASNGNVNWVETSWTTALAEAGLTSLVIDNRGHGGSQKLHDPTAYAPTKMAADAVALLDELGIAKLPVIGYSMGARIAAFMARDWPDRVQCAVLGGMGRNLVTGLGDSEEIIAGLLAPSLADIAGRTGRQFRAFADRTGADRQALAACMSSSREAMSEEDVRRIGVPVLVATGSDDEMAGPADKLAELLPDGRAFTIEKRDHMRATGDPRFKAAATDFLERYGAEHAQV